MVFPGLGRVEHRVAVLLSLGIGRRELITFRGFRGVAHRWTDCATSNEASMRRLPRPQPIPTTTEPSSENAPTEFASFVRLLVTSGCGAQNDRPRAIVGACVAPRPA
jgi:hypothetical protein